MKVVILAGGLGTRISEETGTRPKPMIDIGGKPLLWHIMKIYGHYGVTDFIICLGYKGYVIKEYFANYFLHMSDVTFDVSQNSMEVHHKSVEPWRVTLVDTGETTLTAGRLKRVLPYVGNDKAFGLTYGDGFADIDVSALCAFHEEHGRLATVTAVRPLKRFGALQLDGSRVTEFSEKPEDEGGWINGGFFILSPKVGDYISGDADEIAWEQTPLANLAKADQLRARIHDRFWHPVDTLRDKEYLENLWQRGKAPWKLW